MIVSRDLVKSLSLRALPFADAASENLPASISADSLCPGVPSMGAKRMVPRGNGLPSTVTVPCTADRGNAGPLPHPQIVSTHNTSKSKDLLAPFIDHLPIVACCQEIKRF